MAFSNTSDGDDNAPQDTRPAKSPPGQPETSSSQLASTTEQREETPAYVRDLSRWAAEQSDVDETGEDDFAEEGYTSIDVSEMDATLSYGLQEDFNHAFWYAIKETGARQAAGTGGVRENNGTASLENKDTDAEQKERMNAALAAALARWVATLAPDFEAKDNKRKRDGDDDGAGDKKAKEMM